jgi:hypothetical protein
MSKADDIVTAVTTLLIGHAALAAAQIEQNSALPETVPDGGLIIVRDGEPGEPDRVLGGFRETFYENNTVSIEIFSAGSDAATRDAAFGALVSGIGAALESDLTLGGLVEIMDYGAPAPFTEPVFGADDIKEGAITVTAPFFAATPLA